MPVHYRVPLCAVSLNYEFYLTLLHCRRLYVVAKLTLDSTVKVAHYTYHRSDSFISKFNTLDDSFLSELSKFLSKKSLGSHSLLFEDKL